MTGNTGSDNSIFISDISLDRYPDYQELSAIVDGEKVWFRFPADIPLRARPEAFIPFCLFDAMLRDIPITIDPAFPVSEDFLRGFEEIQNIYTCWNSDLNPVELIAETGTPDQKSNDVYCCYSGGIDSSYSYAKHRKRITHLLVLKGMDACRSDEEWQKCVADRQRFADAEGKKLIEISHNAIEFLHKRNLHWVPVTGSILACLGVTLNAQTFFIPSSNTYKDLFPCGSHPLTDTQWSTDNTTIIHDGLEASRSYKTEFIAHYQELLDQLQVCCYSQCDNCGNCSKCVRTSVILYVLGKKSRSLPDFSIHGDLDQMKPVDSGTLTYMDDFITFMHKHGRHDLMKKLIKMKRKYIISYNMALLGKTILGSRGRKLKQNLFPKPWAAYRTGLTPRNSILDD
ncbi:hypothetical protein [Emcibacter sp.]|uniref:hypothetical protein n=1 Tax=Emcibacter sp. TaxID=1979954 RepID=UPI002AA6C2BF|nr:hypothetical protein [Emcibacter sp.]